MGIGLAALGAAAIAAAGATAASPPTAKIVGGIGTHTDASGNVFAKSGQPITLAVSGDGIACITYAGQTDGDSPFQIDFKAANTEGSQSVQPTLYSQKDKNPNGVVHCKKESTATATATYRVDNSAPQLDAKLSQALINGWNNRDVTLTWSATDVSGIKSGPTPSTDTVTTNTPGVTKTSEATDNLGTKGTGSQFVRVDKSAPDISASLSPEPNALGWNNTDVSVAFSCTDQPGLSGIADCPTSATKVTTEGADQSITGTAKDFAGNSSTGKATVSIDKTAPTLSATPGGTPTNGWHTVDVTVSWDCADGNGSGVVNCPTPTKIAGEGSDLTSTQTISDKAGNETTTSSAAVKIDRTPPATSATAPAGWSSSDAEVTLAGTDGGSGIAATYYKVDGGTRETYIGGVSFSAEGRHSLEFWSV
ncbi:MAG: hypothetical protein M3P40_12855, partial [Actinomycetota bacterium]|nr:hypothetical protein [Actinomycetota bacterium]